jgi:ATP-binding cassette subfamily F protein uup
MRTLAGEHFASAGKLVKGVTVKVVMLSQHLAELDPTWRLIEAVERVATRVELGGGRELSASQLCERLGFDRESQWTPVGDLSGGEKRRLQLTRLLMDSPNVLLLDEPTNDFDIEILTELEDLLDSFAGTLLVISHDRYFLERTCDQIVGLLGDGKVTDLPRGIDQYLEKRAIQIEASLPKANNEKKISSAAEERQNKKDLIRIERQMEKLDSEIKELEKEQEAAAFDAEALLKATEELQAAQAKREALEEEWLSKCV